MVTDMKEMVGKCYGKEENEKVNKGRQTTKKKKKTKLFSLAGFEM
jgi:hypothetical protein